MAIYTQYGSEVTIVEFVDEDFVLIRKGNGLTREVLIVELRADNGLEEIMTTIPENALYTLAAIRESGVTNMLDRAAVIRLAWAENPEAAAWLDTHRDRYMDALNEMGKLVSR